MSADYDEYSDFAHCGDASEGDEFIFIIEGVILPVVSIFGIIGTLMSVGVIVTRDVRYVINALSNLSRPVSHVIRIDFYQRRSGLAYNKSPSLFIVINESYHLSRMRQLSDLVSHGS